ncbi:MAG TPA: molybdopterin-dependent oxidoreductase [Thermodesulfovibrionales bacterium]|nr:molybdopterin-dependent oxidoreductase [Thermodesulfovibrionales bacterium]
MAKTVKLKIDGKEIQASEGMNLIDAAEVAGIHIPNLCYLKGMKGIGACRLCMVEVEGLKAPMIACTTKVKEGMHVKTKTDQVLETRKFVIDLILSMHPLDCMTCTKAGVCNLQNYAYDFEIQESSFTRKKFGFAPDNANPFIKLDPDYCVLCGRCVRVCKNQGTNVLEFMGRGVGSKVTTAGDKPLDKSDCTFCGSCVDVCPVNAILEADRWRRGRNWDYDEIESTCLLCGNACDIRVSTKDGRVMRIGAKTLEGSAEKYICAYGRFGFDSIEADTRVTAPLKRVGGELRETSWEDALDIVAKALKEAGSNSGFLTTGGILNEDVLTLRTLASEAVKTENIDSTVSLYGNAETLLSDNVDPDTADLLVLVDLAPNQWTRVLPALDAIIRRRINAGAKLITIHDSETKTSSVAEVDLPGDCAETLRSLAKALIDKGIPADKNLASAVSQATLTEAVDKAASIYAEAKSVSVLTSPAMYKAAANLALLKGSVVSVPAEANAKGVLLMGVKGDGKTYSDMAIGGLELLYTVGEVPLKTKPSVGLLVVQSSHLTELARQADVVLPSAAYLEADGSIVDYLGRMRRVVKAVEPAGGAKPHRAIFAEIAKAMGADVKEAGENNAKKFAKMKPKVSLNPFTRTDGLHVKVDEIIESMNAPVIDGSRLLWLKESAHTMMAASGV